METSNAIQKRSSCRKYRAEQISREQLDTLIKAANAAPVGMGDYGSYELVIVQDETARKAIDSGTAHAMPVMGDHPTYEAPTLMFICVKPNPQFEMIPYCGASCIAENIMIQATALDLGSVYIMSVPSVMQKKPELLGILPMTEGFLPVILVAVGYAETDTARPKPDRLKFTII
ncbi:MAG: nitroreductase family protein [Synergistaceae bacterium]|nr:nitroreductase family protein [Synergistaceae bacterium]